MSSVNLIPAHTNVVELRCEISLAFLCCSGWGWWWRYRMHEWWVNCDAKSSVDGRRTRANESCITCQQRDFGTSCRLHYGCHVPLLSFRLGRTDAWRFLYSPGACSSKIVGFICYWLENSVNVSKCYLCVWTQQCQWRHCFWAVRVGVHPVRYRYHNILWMVSTVLIKPKWIYISPYWWLIRFWMSKVTSCLILSTLKTSCFLHFINSYIAKVTKV